MKQRNLCILLLLVLTFVLLPACGKETDTKGVKLDLTLLPGTITDSLYVKMNFEFTLSDKFQGLNDDYWIFVHFWRVKNKEMLLVDDHQPEKKISQWKKDDKISYSRVLFIPRFLDEFDIDFEGYEGIKLSVGLYNPRVEGSKILLFQKSINIQSASSIAPEVVYDEGWYQSETDLNLKNKDERTWRWTSKKAACIIENPKKECLLKIIGGVDKAKFEDQKIILKINDKVLEEFIPETSKFSKEYVIAPGTMGIEDEFRFTIETDKTFIPSALNPAVNDDRELGVQVFFLYFRENVK
ncbi:MAG: hypothetical protein NT166_05840 [Candidatus Aminicenantes bacterium]|nr:hypothetical protein [Candidatus Aminicenantes bacterium]